MFTAQNLPAREHIERLIFIYAEALDTGDLERVAGLFERGRICVAGQKAAMEGAAGVRQTLARFTRFYDETGKELVDPLVRRGFPFTRHITSNVYFQSLDAEKAVVHSCFSVLQGLPRRPIETIISGRYVDSFACENDQWYFTERYEYIDLIGDISRHLNINPFG